MSKEKVEKLKKIIEDLNSSCYVELLQDEEELIVILRLEDENGNIVVHHEIPVDSDGLVPLARVIELVADAFKQGRMTRNENWAFLKYTRECCFAE
jgi:hypothetical protein